MQDLDKREAKRAAIEKRAFELYLQRGTDGHDVDDWLAAEQEISERERMPTAEKIEQPAPSKVRARAALGGKDVEIPK